LEAAGLFLGTVNTAAPFNKKGNREPEHIRDLHDALLERNGASWNAPPAGPLAWPSDLLDQLKAQTSELSTAEHWGVKDPRSAFCLEGWKSLYSPRFVVSYRHPSAVVSSLVRRSISWKRPMDRANAYALWASYNRRILDEVSGASVPFIRFGVDHDAYARQLKIICTDLSLNFETAMSFYDADLDTSSSDTSDMPEGCLTIWEQLEAANASTRAGSHG
jgi:hypothetical protein